MRMNNFWITVAHTAKQRIKSKSFLWSTIIISIIVIGIANIQNIIDAFQGDMDGEEEFKERIALITDSESEDFAELLTSFEEGNYQYFIYTDGDVDKAKSAANEGEFDYILTLFGPFPDMEVQFYSSGTDFRLGQEVQYEVQRMKETYMINELGLNQEELAIIYSPIMFTEQPLQDDGDVQTMESHMQSYWMVYILVFAIYMIIIFFGSMIATEVATEKSSKVMELIVSSVNPVTQMFGKIIGIGIAGFLNLGIIILAAFIGYRTSGETFLNEFFQETLDVSLIGYAILFILLGYILYGGLAAMLGALVSRAEEVNQALQPLIFMSMIALFISVFGLNVPDAGFIKVLSYFPFFTPQLLFLRLGMTTVPTWEIILIILILIASAIAVNIIAARIYKGGVLMYGKFSFKEGIKQALRLGKKEG